MRDVEHTVDVTAETLYEAVAAALAALEQDSWVGEIAQGLNTVSVLVQQPPVKHEVKIKDFLSWLARQGGSPADVALRGRIQNMLAKPKRCRCNL
jgi:LysM repeat protein